MDNMHRSVRRRRAQLVLSVMCALIITALGVIVALAHETRTVGKYKVIVGFLNEPPLLYEPNSIDLRVTISDTGKPVEGLEKTLQAEVIFGASTMPIALTARFGQPGAYNGNFIPTKPGTYIFHFTGMIEDTQIDEKFESGPGRFNDVVDTATMQFPVKVPAPADTAAQLKAAQDGAASAQQTAYLGIAAGVLGIILGGLSFLRRK